jgi:hypothetical protein
MSFQATEDSLKRLRKAGIELVGEKLPSHYHASKPNKEQAKRDVAAELRRRKQVLPYLTKTRRSEMEPNEWRKPKGKET